MVVGGYPLSAGGKSEIYNLNGSSQSCPIIQDFPFDSGMFGTFINNKSLVCGGYLESEEIYTSQCWSYDMEVKLYLVFHSMITTYLNNVI